MYSSWFLRMAKGSDSQDQVKGEADSKEQIENRSQERCPDPGGTLAEETGL